MKIGVITNLDKQNYGSVLQAYALKTKLSELGAESFILKKVSTQNKGFFSKVKRILTPSKVKYSFKSKYEIKKARKKYVVKYQKTGSFCKNNLEVKFCSSLNEAANIANQCDIMIAGSDQIWSSSAGLLSEFTLLSFGKEKKYIKASYAASIGVSELSNEDKELFSKCLTDFNTVSLREITGKRLLEDCTNRPIRTDLDPTLLYDRNFWKKLASPLKDTQPYIFVYMIRPEPITLALAKKISEQTGLKIKICSNRIINGNNIENITDAGIEEFLSLFSNAEYVVTNSFHGTAFSVQFHKQFLSIVVSGTGSRTNDFLNSVGLSNRIAKSENDFNLIDKEIIWDEVDNKLNQQRKSSTEYLSGLINESNNNNRNTNISVKRVLSDDNDCTGCSACMNICPKKCIKMKENKIGFIYPEIDLENCINCGMCEKICPSLNMPKRNTAKSFFAAAAKDTEILNNSSSGGVFSVVALDFLEKGGVVFGASTEEKDNALVVKHCSIDKIDDLKLLQGSKYVQSEINDTYRSAEQLLKNGTTVLFSGTPCQIAGLKSFLRKEYHNLYTIEVLCHGVPNNKMFYDYLKNQNEFDGKILDYRFRSKKKGWIIKIAEIILQTSNGQTNKIFKGSRFTSYYSLFLDSYILRDSCYNCKYASKERCADLTIGDYWGVHFLHKEQIKSGIFSEKSGISCVLINTDKGNELLKILSEKCNIVETSFENVRKSQSNLKSPEKRPKMREKLMQDYYEQGYTALEKFANNIPINKKIDYHMQYMFPFSYTYVKRAKNKFIKKIKGKK